MSDVELKTADIRRAAMDLLARREQSRYELTQKLTRRFGEQHQSRYEEEITKLKNEGLQSDERLAGAFIRARTNKGQGPVKIRMELLSKRVSDEVISIAFDESGVDWSELVQRVASKKFGDDLDQGSSQTSPDMKTKARISRFLQQRGFSFEHISSLY